MKGGVIKRGVDVSLVWPALMMRLDPRLFTTRTELTQAEGEAGGVLEILHAEVE